MANVKNNSLPKGPISTVEIFQIELTSCGGRGPQLVAMEMALVVVQRCQQQAASAAAAMSHNRKKVVGEAKVDAKMDIQIPLDYSFKTITAFEGTLLVCR